MTRHDTTDTLATAHQPSRSPMRRLRASIAEDRQRRERRARELLDGDQRFDVLRSLPARRALVVVGYVLAVAAAAVELRDFAGPLGVAAPLVFLLGVGVAFLLRRAVRHTSDAPDDALDERLVAVRDGAHRSAYHILVWATLAAMLAMMIGVGLDLEHRHLQALFWAFAIVAVLTPTAVLAWKQREV